MRTAPCVQDGVGGCFHHVVCALGGVWGDGRVGPLRGERDVNVCWLIWLLGRIRWDVVCAFEDLENAGREGNFLFVKQ